MAAFTERVRVFYQWMEDEADPRVENWLLMSSPLPTIVLFFLYLFIVWYGPQFMQQRKAISLRSIIIPYNFGLVVLSLYMFYEFVMSAALARYSFKCQPVDYSNDPLAIRMAKVCWWFFFSKVIELLDTVFIILRKKNEQISFLHVYHHCTMILNWYLGVKYIAGGQSFFVAMLNSLVHIFMYTYYGLAAIGPHMQKYLWWKRYLTKLQLTQFVGFVIHTACNMMVDCDYSLGFNIAVLLYALSLIALFGNFYYRTYTDKQRKLKKI